MFKKYTLDNGVRVVYEKIPHVRSVSAGIWVGTGSRNEKENNNGISHFIEHMLFKGTEKRTAKEIAESFDNIGGQVNAFTGKECTCFYSKTLDDHIGMAFDVLSDMFFNSTFTKKDISVEKNVILEEIGMYEDSPEELVHDILSETVWNGNSIGYPILGSKKCLKGINEDNIRKYMDENYTPSNTVISIAGNFDEDNLMKLLEVHFGGWKLSGGYRINYEDVVFQPGLKVKRKDTEQVHACIGFKGVEHGDESLYPLLAVNNVFGGGMSSRLFQKIREKKGLVYSIYSYPSAYRKAGLFTIYAGMKPENLNQVIDLVKGEIKLLVKRGLKPDELEKSKEQLKGSYILGLESTSSRMNSMGKSELLLRYIDTQEDILRKINAITMDSVNSVIDNIFCMDRIGISIVGDIEPGFSL